MSAQKRRRASVGLRGAFGRKREVMLAAAAALVGGVGLRAEGADVVSTWNGSTGLWTTAGNWVNVPATANFPSNGNGGFTFDAVIGGGAVTADVPITVQKLTLTGGGLTANSTLVANELVTWGGGSLSGTGSLSSAGGMLISGAAHTLVGLTIDGVGTTTWSAGAINSGQGAVFNNSGTFAATVNGTWSFNQGGGQTVFNNSGVFQRPAGIGQTILAVRFNNTGTVVADVGAIALRGGGASSGRFVANAGSTIEIDADYTLDPGASMGGSGTVRLTAGTLTVGGNVTATNFDLAGGAIGGGGDFSASRLNWTGGQMTGPGTTTVAPGSNLVMGGVIKTFTQRTISNSGTATWSGGSINSGGGARFENHGSFLAGEGSWSFNQGGDATVFNNHGAFSKATGNNAANVNVVFNNIGPGGTVQVDNGTLTLGGGGSSTGSFVVGAGRLLNFNANYALETGTTIGGDGMARLSSGTLSVNGDVPVARLEQIGGTLGGAGTLTITGLLEWSGGTVSGSGTSGGATVIAPGASAVFDSGIKTLSGRRILNQGSLDWSAGNINGGAGSVIENAGTMALNVNGQFSGAASRLENRGTLNKSQFASSIFGSFINSGTVSLGGGSLILLGGGTHTGRYDAGAGATLSFNGGTHDVSGGASVGGGGTVLFDSGTVNVNGGTYDLAGTSSVNGGTVNFNTPGATTHTLDVVSGVIGGGGTITATSAFTWSAGTMSGTGATVIGPGATGSIEGASSKILTGRRVINRGTTGWSGGTISSGLGAVIRNEGTFNASGGTQFNSSQGTPAAVFENVGTFNRGGASGTTRFSTASFNNSGTVGVSTGTLALDGGGSHSGVFNALAGGTLSFGGGTHVVDGVGASVGGAGVVGFEGGTTNLNAGTYDVSGTTRVTAGVANFNLPNAITRTLAVTGGTLGGSGDVTVGGQFDWTGGTIGGGSGVVRIAAEALASIGGTTKFFSFRSIANSGSANWSAGNFSTGDGARLINTGTFTTSFDGAMTQNLGGALASVENAGQYVKSAGAGQNTIGILFFNTGTVTANSGRIVLTGGGSGGGHFVAGAAGAGVDFANEYTLSGGARLSGPGEHRIILGTLTLTGDVSAERLAHNLGTLTGPGNLDVSAVLSWNGGTTSGPGATRVAPGAVLNMAGNVKTILRDVVNSGTTNWTAGSVNAGEGGDFLNAGTFVNTFGGFWSFNQGGTASQFNNAGLFHKTTSADNTIFSHAFNNAGTVRVDVGNLMLSASGSSSGRFELAGGAGLEVMTSATHTLAQGAAVTGEGMLRVGSGGTLTVTGTEVRVDHLTQNGHLGGGGTLLIDRSYRWDAGSMTGTGTTSIAPGASGNWTGSIKTLTGGRVIHNAGSVVWDGGNVNAGQGVIVHNAGTLTANSGFFMSFAQNQGGTQATFNNTSTGVFAKGGTGIAEIAASFNNAGVTRVNLGVLSLTGGGTSTGRFELAAGAQLLSSADIDLAAGSVVTGDGTFSVGAATAHVAGDYDVGTTIVRNATFDVPAGATPNTRTPVTRELVFESIAGRVELNNNSMVVDYAGASVLADIRSRLASGYAGGAWNGAGIRSSSAAADPGKGLGYGESSEVLNISGAQTGTFNDRTVDATAVLIKYVLRGDTNLDGRVDFNDLAKLAQNYNVADGQRVWTQGDFSYDGNVNFDDLAALAQNYNAALPGGAIPGAPAGFYEDWAAAVAAVPEPAAGMALVALGMAGMGRRRGRRLLRSRIRV